MSVIAFILVLPPLASTIGLSQIRCDNGKTYAFEEIEKLKRPLARPVTEEAFYRYQYATRSICDHGSADGFVPDKENFRHVEFPIPRLVKQFGVPLIISFSVLAGGLMLLLFVRWAVFYILYGKKK